MEELTQSNTTIQKAYHLLAVLSLPASAFLMWSIVRLIYYAEPSFWSPIFLPLSALVLVSIFAFHLINESNDALISLKNKALIRFFIWFVYIESFIFIVVLIFWLVLTVQIRPS